MSSVSKHHYPQSCLKGIYPGQLLSSRNQPSNLPHLFQPFTLRSVTFKNRIGVSPMCMYSSIDGFASAFHSAHIPQYAMRGAGLVIMEATAVHPNGRISPRDLGLWKDEQIPALRRLTEFAGMFGCRMGIQLAHAGRKGSTFAPFMGERGVSVPIGEPDNKLEESSVAECVGFETVAPSAIPYSEKMATPRALTHAEIKSLVEDFRQAAIRADKAGFDLVEIHAAHGYLIHQFLSPLTNKRKDEYGAGSFETRVRFCVEICEAVRSAFPQNKPVFIRFSCTDYAEGGWTLDETIKLASLLREKNLIDLVDCSSGALVEYQNLPPLVPGYQVPYSDALRSSAKINTAAVGLITGPKQAENILAEGKADIILMAREFLRNPNWVFQAAKELDIGREVAPLPQYGRA